MTLVNYDFDMEFRQFTFFCKEYDHGTKLGEPINEDYCPCYENGTKYEPLIFEELQNLDEFNNTTPISTVTSEDGEMYVDFFKRIQKRKQIILKNQINTKITRKDSELS